MRRRVHAIAGAVAFATILVFWSGTVMSVLFGPPTAVAAVKAAIVWGLIVLIPALAAVGASGMALGRHRNDRSVQRKKRRMPIIAGNGLVILVPCAIFLSMRADRATFDAWYYGIQGVELIAGAANLTLMGLSLRDGLTMTGRMRRRSTRRTATDRPVSERFR